MTDRDPQEPEQRTVTGYNRMLERVKSTLDDAGHNTLPNLRQGVERARST